MTIGAGALGQYALGEIPVPQETPTIEACAHVQLEPAYFVEVQIVENCKADVEVQDDCPC